MRARLPRRLREPEWSGLLAMGGVVVLLHLLGWGLLRLYSHRYASLPGLGTLAYTFGLRHAFDADHIAAIDNTTRKFLDDGKRALGVGFYFSLGHATIVFALTAGLAVAASAVGSTIPVLEDYGGYAGTGVSAAFLWIIGVLNLLVLIDIVRILADMRRGSCHGDRLERRLLERGFLNRFLLGRLSSKIGSSWQMYPLGALFGLGFDTASEVGLLAVAAGVTGRHLPLAAIVSLPLLFAAGMSLVDTADGAFTSHAYGWALSHPVRRVYYNLTVTGLSVAIALAVGTIEVLQVATRGLKLHGSFRRSLDGLDLGHLGYATVTFLVLAWAATAIVWKAARSERR